MLKNFLRKIPKLLNIVFCASSSQTEYTSTCTPCLSCKKCKMVPMTCSHAQVCKLSAFALYSITLMIKLFGVSVFPYQTSVLHQSILFRIWRYNRCISFVYEAICDAEWEHRVCQPWRSIKISSFSKIPSTSLG